MVKYSANLQKLFTIALYLLKWQKCGLAFIKRHKFCFGKGKTMQCCINLIEMAVNYEGQSAMRIFKTYLISDVTEPWHNVPNLWIKCLLRLVWPDWQDSTKLLENIG